MCAGLGPYAVVETLCNCERGSKLRSLYLQAISAMPAMSISTLCNWLAKGIQSLVTCLEQDSLTAAAARHLSFHVQWVHQTFGDSHMLTSSFFKVWKTNPYCVKVLMNVVKLQVDLADPNQLTNQARVLYLARAAAGHMLLARDGEQAVDSSKHNALCMTTLPHMLQLLFLATQALHQPLPGKKHPPEGKGILHNILVITADNISHCLTEGSGNDKPLQNKLRQVLVGSLQKQCSSHGHTAACSGHSSQQHASNTIAPSANPSDVSGLQAVEACLRRLWTHWAASRWLSCDDDTLKSVDDMVGHMVLRHLVGSSGDEASVAHGSISFLCTLCKCMRLGNASFTTMLDTLSTQTHCIGAKADAALAFTNMSHPQCHFRQHTSLSAGSDSTDRQIVPSAGNLAYVANLIK